MPLLRTSSDQVLASARSNDGRNRWPAFGDERMEGLVHAHCTPSFTIDAGDRIFTIGSCFAREVERRLSELKFELPMYGAVIDDELARLGQSYAFKNKYNSASIRLELEWALDSSRPMDDSLFVILPDGSWHDLFFAPDKLVHLTAEDAQCARRLVEGAVQGVRQCRIVIITLGLSEVWLDTRTGLHINATPPIQALKADRERFVFEVQSYDEILADLEAIHEALSRRGHPEFKILITVSPVAFKSTLRGEDVICANTYSKAVLRTAVEAFRLAHENVDYFPSLEIAMHSPRRAVYKDDNRHVLPQAVSTIVDRFLAEYATA